MLDKSKSDKARPKIPWAVVINMSDDETDSESAEAEASETPQPDVEPEADAEFAADTVDASAEETAGETEPEHAAPAEEAESAEIKERAESEAQCDDAVVRSLMDVLITPTGMVQPQEQVFAADLLLLVMDYATDEAKHMLCERLSNMPDAPAGLITRFVNDPDLELSASLLLNASCVSDSELISVVEAGEHDRKLLVAKRRHLSAAVSTALAKTGDIELALALVNNPYAQISQEALERLAVLAIAHDDLMEPLVMRPEMTAACALYLFWAMPAKQRSYALGRFLAEVQLLQQILVMSTPGSDLLATALSGGGEQGRSKETKAGDQEKPSKKKAEDLVAALLAGDAAAASTAIAKHAAIDRGTADRIVADTGGEALTVACKALGVSRFALADALEAWQKSQERDPETEPLQILFDTLSFKQARMALTYWDWQIQKIGPYKDAY